MPSADASVATAQREPLAAPSLKAIPRHWSVRRLKYCARVLMGQSPPGHECGPGPGLPFLQGCAEFGNRYPVADQYCAYPPRAAPQDSILLSVRAPVGRLNRADKEYGIGRGLCAVIPDNRHLLTDFAFYLLEASRDMLRTSATGSTYDAVTVNDIGNHPMALPPISEQARITAHLDSVTADTEALIANLQRRNELLTEQQQVVVGHAVTQGLHRGVRSRPSGVPWLGDVPEHWGVGRLRSCAEVRVSNVDKHSRDYEHGVRLCNYVDVYYNDSIRSEMSFMRATATASEIKRFGLVRGDVLITKDSEAWNDIGVPALVSDTSPDLVSGYHLAILRPHRDRLLGEYLLRVLQSRVAHQFHVAAKGVTRYGLSYSDIKSVRFPVPPLREQRAIVRHLDQVTADIYAALTGVQREIKLLKEYRARLIADVVTGRLDVREAADSLPGPNEKGA